MSFPYHIVSAKVCLHYHIMIWQKEFCQWQQSWHGSGWTIKPFKIFILLNFIESLICWNQYTARQFFNLKAFECILEFGTIAHVFEVTCFFRSSQCTDLANTLLDADSVLSVVMKFCFVFWNVCTAYWDAFYFRA